MSDPIETAEHVGTFPRQREEIATPIKQLNAISMRLSLLLSAKDKTIAALSASCEEKERECAELKTKVRGACIHLQGGEDVEVAAKRMFETNYANQQSVIRLSDELTALEEKCKELRRGLSLFQSVIKCGEPWTATCEEVMRKISATGGER